MKVTIDIDCTPLEARQFLGLPDVQPMQEAVMAQLESRLVREIEHFTAEKLLETWAPLMSANRELLGTFFSAMAKQAGSPAAKTKTK
ncbi:MAG: DUF6489 family protein [Rhodoblastus sp.]